MTLDAPLLLVAGAVFTLACLRAPWPAWPTAPVATAATMALSTVGFMSRSRSRQRSCQRRPDHVGAGPV